MYCSNCGKRNDEGDNFCKSCGRSINVKLEEKKEFTNYYFLAFKKYDDFKGRASRTEYWYFLLFHSLITLFLLIGSEISAIDLTLIYTIYYIVSFIPFLFLSIRRMHDIDSSGWFLLVPIYNFISLFMPGTKGNNRYGEDPQKKND